MCRHIPACADEAKSSIISPFNHNALLPDFVSLFCLSEPVFHLCAVPLNLSAPLCTVIVALLNHSALLLNLYAMPVTVSAVQTKVLATGLPLCVVKLLTPYQGTMI